MSALRSAALFLALLGVGRPALAQETAGGLEARVWLDRGGDEPALRRGDEVRVYYRTNEDAFAAIFRVDTDGRVHLLYPQHPEAIDVVRRDRDYRLLFPEAPAWRVTEDPGVGYLFIVASPDPLDFSSFLYDDFDGWDVSGVGDVVYSDPYVAIDDYVAAIVPGWETAPYALDFLTYSVSASEARGGGYAYPRFLCYDCHGFRPYASWNPYAYTCSTFRVVIWDDPYFYARFRYVGTRVVFARPVRVLPRYELTRRVVGDAVAPIIRVRDPALRRAVTYKEPGAAATRVVATPARRSASAVSPTPARSSSSLTASPSQRSGARTALARSGQERPRADPTRDSRGYPAPRLGAPTPQQAPDTAKSRPTLQRRPSARLPVRTPPADPSAPRSGAQREPQGRQPATTPDPSAPRSRARAPSGTREPQAAPSGRSSGSRIPQGAPPASRPPQAREPQGSASPSRPPARGVPSRPSEQPSGSRPQLAPRSGTSRSDPSASRSGAPSSAPSRPNPGASRSGGATPQRSDPRASRSGAPPARSSTPRPRAPERR